MVYVITPSLLILAISMINLIFNRVVQKIIQMYFIKLLYLINASVKKYKIYKKSESILKSLLPLIFFCIGSPT